MDTLSSALTISSGSYDAVIFDLDGVITRTARAHAAAWKTAFDEYLQRRAAISGDRYSLFDADLDYRLYVDGKPRRDGVRGFLASRGIRLPEGHADDATDRETVSGLGNRKNQLFLEYVKDKGVEVYPSSVDLIRNLKSKKFKTALVTSSENSSAILNAAGISDLFDVKIDGIDSRRLHLKGKPAPDIFLAAARRLHIPPPRAVVVEDAIAGVRAGNDGNFGYVVGVDRTGHPEALKEAGADIVVTDLSELGVDG